MGRNKIILTIIITLLAGFIIGFFTSGRLVKHRIDRKRRMMNQPGAEKEMLLRKLQLGEEQSAQISPILDSAITAQISLRKEGRKEHERSRKEMFKKIMPLLKEDQKQILRELRANKKKHRPH